MTQNGVTYQEADHTRGHEEMTSSFVHYKIMVSTHCHRVLTSSMTSALFPQACLHKLLHCLGLFVFPGHTQIQCVRNDTGCIRAHNILSSTVSLSTSIHISHPCCLQCFLNVHHVSGHRPLSMHLIFFSTLLLMDCYKCLLPKVGWCCFPKYF